ncbi:MAG: FAD-binding protein [Flammeovirgaceae bacterium]
MTQATAFTNFPSLAGTLSTQTEDLVKVGQDFGKIVLTHPIGVLKPKHIDDIGKAVRYAIQHNLKILPRGMAHSAFGQSQCDGGIVIDMSSFNEILEKKYSPVNSWMYVEAGATWNKLIKQSIQDDYAPPATTDWQFLTIGGTLSTGGVGYMTHQKGLLADNILELDVVTGEGQIKTCSLVQNHELFHAVRGGLGQFGIIARAKVQLEPAPQHLQVFQFFHLQSQPFFQDIQQLLELQHFDCLHSFVLPNQAEAIIERIGEKQFAQHEEQLAYITAQPQRWIYFTELAKYAKSATSSEIRLRKLQFTNRFFMQHQEHYFDYIHKEPPLISAEKKMGKMAHPELTLTMPAHAMPRFMDDTLAELSHSAMGGGTILLIPMLRHKILTPLFQTPEARHLFFVGILRNAPMDDQELIAQQMEHNLSLYQKVRNFGGKRYPCDSISEPSTVEGWQAHFGESKWKKVQELKYLFDPHHLFLSNLKMF